MGLELLNKDQVSESPWVDEELKQVLQDAHELAVSLLENSGFTNYEFCHPVNEYDVSYFVRDGKVIMVDMHDSNAHDMKVLDERDTAWVLENIRREFGEQELHR